MNAPYMASCVQMTTALDMISAAKQRWVATIAVNDHLKEKGSTATYDWLQGCIQAPSNKMHAGRAYGQQSFSVKLYLIYLICLSQSGTQLYPCQPDTLAAS